MNELTWFIAIGDQMNWGRAQSRKQAVANMRRQASTTKDYIVYSVTEKTYVNDMGGFTRPTGDPAPVEVYRNFRTLADRPSVPSNFHN